MFVHSFSPSAAMVEFAFDVSVSELVDAHAIKVEREEVQFLALFTVTKTSRMCVCKCGASPSSGMNFAVVQEYVSLMILFEVPVIITRCDIKKIRPLRSDAPHLFFRNLLIYDVIKCAHSPLLLIIHREEFLNENRTRCIRSTHSKAC